MTLDEAIAIAKKVSEDESADARGRKDYRQIAAWLEELKQSRSRLKSLDGFNKEEKERMNLDEAIDHSKELSEDQSVCEDCREEHKQLAEWLEELKQYKEEKHAKRELKLFSVEVALTPDVEDNAQLETHIEGSRPEMMAFLKTMDVDPKELESILKHAVKAMLRDFVQQVVNLSESLEGAEMEETED